LSFTGHPDAMMLQNNLATAYHEAGRADEAIAPHEQTLATCEQVPGPSHPHTLISQHNLDRARSTAARR
jgi:hypothetical protein